FHGFNETHGTTAGDQALRGYAQMLRSVVPADLIVARLAGDRFAILLDPLSRMDAPVILALRLMAVMEKPVTISDQPARLDLAVGTAGHRFPPRTAGGAGGERSAAATLRSGADRARCRARRCAYAAGAG